MNNIKKASISPESGDGFIINISSLPELRGCVVRDDAIVGPFRNALLIYVFKPDVDDIRSSFIKYGLDSLLLPSLIINTSPWENGTFIPSGEIPLHDLELPPRHIFQNRLNGKTFDEYSEPIVSDGKNVGDFALKFDSAVIAMIRQSYHQYYGREKESQYIEGNVLKFEFEPIAKCNVLKSPQNPTRIISNFPLTEPSIA